MTYNNMVKSVLIYGAETWSLYEDDRRRINGTNMDALRRAARISKLDRKPNEYFNPLNAELNPICYLLALLGAHHFLHVSRIRVKSLTLRLLMSYIYKYRAPILDVSRSHTTTNHSR